MYYVQDIMVSKVVTVSENATVSQAAKLMAHHNIGSLVVVPEHAVHSPRLHFSDAGLITERDILMRVVAQDKPTSMRVHEVANRNPPHIEAGSSIGEALDLMSTHQIRWIIVSNGDYVTGVVSQTDLTNAIRFSSARRLTGQHDRDHFRSG